MSALRRRDAWPTPTQSRRGRFKGVEVMGEDTSMVKVTGEEPTGGMVVAIRARRGTSMA
jgi:hypothetical protein